MGIDSVQPIDLSSVGTTTSTQQRAAARYVVTKATSRAEAAELLAMLGLDKQPPRKPRKVQRRDGWPSDLGPKPKADRAPAGPGAVVELAWTDRARCRYQPERWWTDDKLAREEAQKLCVTCPVRRECAQRAHDTKEKAGMAAGFDLSTSAGQAALRVYLEVDEPQPARQRRTVVCPECGSEFSTTRRKVAACATCVRAKSPAMTDAGPVVAYLEWLRDECRIPSSRIAEAAGVSPRLVRGVLTQRPRSMRVTTARRILALQPQGVAP